MKKEEEKKVKIMVFGTFDGLHKGHMNFLRQARNLARRSFLIVSIGRDKNVYRIKGHASRYSDEERRLLLKKSGLADKVVLSGLKDHIPHILKARPDIIALGYDQKEYTRHLKRQLEANGLQVKIKRLKPYKENIYKTHLLRLKK